MSGKQYKVQVRCENCGVRQTLEIPYGTELKKHPCPNCGVLGMLSLHYPGKSRP